MPIIICLLLLAWVALILIGGTISLRSQSAPKPTPRRKFRSTAYPDGRSKAA